MSKWSELRDKLAGARKGRLPHFERQIKELVEAGFKMATPEMEALYSAYVGEFNKELGSWDYFDRRQSTYPSIRRTKPNDDGLYAYGTHDRSERIGEAIDKLTELHKDDIEAGKAWLMPVLDDEECVSWEFDVAVGTEEEVLATLKRAAAQR